MDEYVLIGEVADRLNMQTQYVMHYLYGLGTYPNLSEGIRYIDDVNYHQIKIHKDDVDKFVDRIRKRRMEGFY